MVKMKALRVIKDFFEIPSVDGMKQAIAGFDRPLSEDQNYRWIVEEAAKQLNVEVEW